MAQDKIKIFLADDDEDDRYFFNSALQSVSVSVELACAMNGEQVIHFFKEKKGLPDFVFLDINMPRTDGLECLRYIKKLYPSGGPIVIMLSTASSSKIIEQCYKSGASLYIEKPNSVNELARYLDYCLHHFKTASSLDDFLLNSLFRSL